MFVSYVAGVHGALFPEAVEATVSQVLANQLRLSSQHTSGRMVIAFESSLGEWASSVEPPCALIANGIGMNFDEWKRSQQDRVRQIEEEEAAVLASRRALVKQTKEMKQLPEGEQHLRMAELLRLYQQEIDGLGNRLKTSFALFRDSVAPLMQLSDPLPAMQVGLEQAEQLADLEMLQRENTDLRLSLEASNALCQRQSKQLEEAQRSHGQIQELSHVLESKDQSLRDLNGLLANQEKECMRLTNRNEELVIELGKLKKANDDLLRQAEDLNSTRTQQESIKLAEFEVVNMNLENTRRQVVELQRENELLVLEIKSLGQNEPSLDSRKIAELEEDVLDLQAKLEEERARRSHEQRDRDRRLETLQRKLDELSDVEKSLEELKRMKAAEYPDLYTAEHNQSLEALLQMKNKKLETDLVHARNNLREVQHRLESLEADMAAAGEKNAELQRIITRYEESATIAAIVPASNDSGVSLASASTVGADSTVLTVLTNQRDRLKRYSEELEIKNSEVCAKLEAEKMQSAKLQTDNLKLFERIRFLENFNQKRSQQQEPVDSELGDLLHQYLPAYEARLDPFRLFFQNEVVKRFRSLGQTDRTVWKLGRIFLTNKFIRRFMVTYFILLHVIMLYFLLCHPSAVVH